MEARLVEENGGSEFNKLSIISLIVADEKFNVIPVPLQYCGSHMKMLDFYNHLYIYVFIEMDLLVLYNNFERKGEYHLGESGWLFSTSDVHKKEVNEFTLTQIFSITDLSMLFKRYFASLRIRWDTRSLWKV
ncbi:hypothetical protein H5410_005450 [Solanum commersonii]|uniref:Uncharacterized protein n=1 Tax=Solanum commersonii TaxID=4109 RepID=A0A9J6A776_SOLCO|nr:hypothetical protein H5410_005450 [Solanum commersonii]